jgi:phosphoribosylanthranilate isomerase
VVCRVKVCGITNLEDARQAVFAGADALGFVFYRPSPRYIDPMDAAKIIASLPPFVVSVGLFVNEEATSVASILDTTGLDLIQFHGDETPQFCEGFDRPYIKALRVASERHSRDDVAAMIDAFSSARGVLLDTYRKGVPGGTGEVFDWDLVPQHSQNIILAGGLDPCNVAAAVQRVAPYAVDVSGGVEASHGVKDANKIIQFISAVKSARVRERSS